VDAYQISLVLAFALAIAEMLTLSFILLGFGMGMLAVAALQYATGGYSLNRDLLVFVLASAIAILTLRRLFKKTSDQKRLEQDDINQY
jgi:membrane protein implicated in regulation of membrane protease activity